MGKPRDRFLGGADLVWRGQLGAAPSHAQTITVAHASLPRNLIIYKRFGAALRKSPSSNARIVRMLPRGQDLAVVKAMIKREYKGFKPPTFERAMLPFSARLAGLEF